MVSTVANTEESLTSSQSINQEQVATFLKEHEEVEMIIPVMFGLFVTSKFQLRGANALLVNLGVATVFRQLFRELKKTSSEATSEKSVTQKPSQAKPEEITILHSVNGRVRLRIPQLKEDAIFAKRLERLLNNDDNVLSVKINRTIASVTINYDAGNLSDMELQLKLMSLVEAAKEDA